jgi:hypothetical protein
MKITEYVKLTEVCERLQNVTAHTVGMPNVFSYCKPVK